MADYHHDFWVAVAAAGPLLALAVVQNINQYFVAEIWRRITAIDGVDGDLRGLVLRYRATRVRHRSPGGDEELRLLVAAAVSQFRFNVIAWLGFALTAVATVVALLSLAWQRDLFGHDGLLFAAWSLVGAGGTVPVLGYVKRTLRRRLKAVGMSLDDLE